MIIAKLNETQLKRAEDSAAFMFYSLKELYNSILEHFEDDSSIPEPIWSKYVHAEHVIGTIEEDEDCSPEAPWGYCNICEMSNVGPGECGNCD